MTNRLNVFISSTSEDLGDYRAVARHVVLDLQWHPVMMEHFGAATAPTVAACCERVEQADLVILLAAYRRGWVPDEKQGGNGQDSVTALELAHARSRSIPVLIFLAAKTWPGDLWEDDADARAWVKRFHGGLNQPAQFFEWEEPSTKEQQRLPVFRAKLRAALVEHKEQRLQKQPQSGAGLEFFDLAQSCLRAGKVIPFVGPGVFGDGPLSASALAKGLSRAMNSDDGAPLATAAEYAECLSTRELFLEQFRELLEKQSQQVTATAAHELLVAATKPPLIVSASFDLVLEDALRRAGHRVAIVTHIRRSRDHDPDGRILLLRDGEAPVSCVANQVQLRDDEYTIYKPLGSPLLHRQLDADLEIDTVVVTEADHLALFSRLENQETRIPNAFTLPFRKRTWLFLGYALDVWQYRLVVQVLRSLGAADSQRSARQSRLAVRRPSSDMEHLAWRRLPADLVAMDVNEFGARVMERGAS